MKYPVYTIYGLFAFVAVYTIFVVLGTPSVVIGAFVNDGVVSADRPWSVTVYILCTLYSFKEILVNCTECQLPTVFC